MSVPAVLPVQTPLNLVMPIKQDALVPLLTILGAMDGHQSPLRAALRELGNVHYAQFVLLENRTRLGVFTIYDGNFDDYILSFVEHIGHVFNLILKHIGDGADALVPVQKHREEFLQFIRSHDLPGAGLFSAYPNRRAFDILDALEVNA